MQVSYCARLCHRVFRASVDATLDCTNGIICLMMILCICLCDLGVWSIQNPWLPCQFTDEHVFTNNEGHTETRLIHREAMLQFGQKEDAPVNPNTITLLITGELLQAA